MYTHITSTTIIFLLFSLIQSVDAYNYRVIKTSIFHFTDIIKQHHIVIIEPRDTKPGLYAVDFTPVKQNNWKTLVYLLFGMNVEAEIRVRYIKDDIHIEEKAEIIQEKWEKDSLVVRPVGLFYPINELEGHHKWRNPQYMNLYTHNCQHFSHDLTQVLDTL